MSNFYGHCESCGSFEKVLKDKVKGQYRKKKGTRVVFNALS